MTTLTPSLEVDLLAGWSAAADREAKYFEGDEETLGKANMHVFKARTFEDYVDAGGLDPANERVLQTGLIPQPYVGDLASASIVFLLRNPGLRAGDFIDEQNIAYRQALVDNLKQASNRAFPFIFLDPQFAWTGGGEWWRRKLSPLLKRVQRRSMENRAKSVMPYTDAMKIVSRQIAAIELVGYHSQWSEVSKWTSLPSRRAAQTYVEQLKGKKKIYLLNGTAEWRSVIPEVNERTGGVLRADVVRDLIDNKHIVFE